MKFSLVYTSRRAQAVAGVVLNWLKRAERPECVEVILGIDVDYAEGLEVARRLEGYAQTIGAEGQVALTVVKLAINYGAPDCVAGWNAAAMLATGDVLIAVADDFAPPDNWDAELKAAGPEGWWDEDRVMAVADGYNPDLFTLAILTRRRYRGFGYMFNPSYRSLFSDTEFTYVAKQDGVVIDATHLLFEHLHPDAGKRARDQTDLTHASSQRWKHGELLFNLRRDTGFPLDSGPRADALEEGYQNLRFAAYVQAIRDDFCLHDVLARIADEAAILFPSQAEVGHCLSVYVAVPDEYWGGKPQPSWDRAEIDAAAKRFTMTHPGVPLCVFPQPVAPHRLPGLSRIQVETRVRNAAVERIRADGIEHILILDGDELWQPGLFAKLVAFVREYRPASVFTGMVPVIGLPGYPIDGATDKATIYIGPRAWFTECRGASGHRHEIPGVDVIHFTGTRRTMEEIVSKMRESGHADDPNYAFEEWIDKVLPSVKPGFTHQWTPTNNGLHMFLPYQIWPVCRAWRPEEWAQLPEAVKPYLAAP